MCFSKLNLPSHTEDHTCDPRDNRILNDAQSSSSFLQEMRRSPIIWRKAPGPLKNEKTYPLLFVAGVDKLLPMSNLKFVLLQYSQPLGSNADSYLLAANKPHCTVSTVFLYFNIVHQKLHPSQFALFFGIGLSYKPFLRRCSLLWWTWAPCWSWKEHRAWSGRSIASCIFLFFSMVERAAAAHSSVDRQLFVGCVRIT